MANKRVADFKRDGRPQRGKASKVDPKQPGPVTYKVEQKDLGKMLSTKKRLTTFSFGGKDK